MDARIIDLKVKITVTRHWLPYARKKCGLVSE